MESAYLFIDTFAFEKLAQQPECRVGQRNARMQGYETYLIEQWACERRINTVVASYTGNAQHVVEVQVLLVPANLNEWSAVTRAHFEELVRMHILPKETPLGNMLVTSISSLPSNLTLVSMPPLFRTGLVEFVVNENLKRLRVVGRVAVTAEAPSDSLLSTFYRVFDVNTSVPYSYAILELVTLMQISLFYFGLLEPQHVDGLLCDLTIKAIETWWTSFGRQRFIIATPSAHDKLYMRTSCAALIGLVIGARQRFSALGLKPPKDPFDAEEFTTCIRRFQKQLKLPRTLQLDDQTYFKLVHETAKIGLLGGTNVLTVMKSTVKESFSGKTSEALDDWETTDLNVLAKNVRGDRAKYLWHGRGHPLVAHLGSDMGVNKVGETTKISLFSLEMHDTSDQKQHNNKHHEHKHEPKHKHEKIDKTEPEKKLKADLVMDSAQTLATPPPVSQPVSNACSTVHLDDTLRNPAPHQLQLQSPHPLHARGLSSSSEIFSKHEKSDTDEEAPAKEPKEPIKEPYQCPYVDIPASKLLTRDDMTLKSVRPAAERSRKLRRTSSLSQIESYVFLWDSLVPVPGLLSMYGRAKTLRSELSGQLTADKDIVVELKSHSKVAEQQLNKVHRDAMLIKYHVNASTKKEEVVRLRVKELDAFMARIDYEMATLSVKIRDVDQSIMTFAAKVDAAEAKWKTLTKVKRKTWYSLW